VCEAPLNIYYEVLYYSTVWRLPRKLRLRPMLVGTKEFTVRLIGTIVGGWKVSLSMDWGRCKIARVKTCLLRIRFDCEGSEGGSLELFCLICIRTDGFRG
jgi:hypothetical protein